MTAAASPPPNAPVRVVHVRWGEPVGGVETLLRDMARQGAAAQLEQHFIFLARGGPFADTLRAEGHDVHVIAARHGADLAMRWQLAARVRRLRPDIVHEHGLPPLVRPVLRWATPAPLLSFDHGEAEINRRKGKAWLNRLHGWERRWLVRCVVVNSRANARLAQIAYGLRPQRIRIVPLGLDLTDFRLDSSLARPPELRLGYVGRIQNYDKGTDDLPRLAQRLVQRAVGPFRLFVLGVGPDESAVRQLADELGVGPQLEFLGRRLDVPEQLQQIDIVVVPSRTEAFGLTAIEALATGARVAGFAVGGLPEVLDNCPGVRLVSAGDVEALAAAVQDLWQQFGKQRLPTARQFVIDRYSIHRMLADLHRLYREVLAAAG